MTDLDSDSNPPPVPPKDHKHIRRMMSTEPSSPPPSTSKRKRAEYSHDEDLDHDDEFVEHTPKRSKAITGNTQSSGTSSKPGSKLRRKKGVNNLSSLNLRHQAEEQGYSSKFQEGSLTDRPSDMPPSEYLRQGMQTDTLMNDYHNGMPTPRVSMDTPQQNSTSSDGFFSRISRSIAAFPPIAAWNKVYAQTKEELTQKNIAEIKRKMRLKAEAEEQARMKAEAEARYQEMKKAGEIPTKTVPASARDSGIELLDDRNHSSLSSYAPASTEGSFDDTPLNRTLRSRLSFIRRPSLNNLRFDLRRPKSELNLHGAARESSSSISPLKTDDTMLRKSPSKLDLRRQQKLSKRVSDLEGKLQIARQELGEALAQASPMPKLTSKHTWGDSTIKRNKFVPGMLPSLPSERLLDPAIINGFGGADRADHVSGIAALDEDEEYGEDTIKASTRRAYPALTASLFERGDVAKDVPDVVVTQASADPIADGQHAAGPDEVMDETHVEEGEIEIHLEAEPAAKPQARRRKRKSGESEKAYRPEEDEMNDDELDHESPKQKKHKSSKIVVLKAKKTQVQKTKQHSVDRVESSDVDDLAVYEPGDTVAEGEEKHSIRDSIDSTAHSLEPVYEEEEDSVAVPLNDDPKQPTAVATPARLGRITRLPKAKTAKAGAEEAMITRAARAVHQHPARQASTRNAKDQDFKWPDDVF